MSSTLSAQTVRAVAEVAIGSGRRVRFAMRGRSMLPLLHEPMLLVVAPLEGRARVGELLVFAHSCTQVVHRVVGFAGDDYVTAGDAQPRISERVASTDVLGRVESVWEDGSPTARRVDTHVHRLRGTLYGLAYPVRRRTGAARARLHAALSRGRDAFAGFRRMLFCLRERLCGALSRVRDTLSRRRDVP